MSLTNDRLLERSRAGDVDAFQELINQYEKKIYTIAYRFMGNHEDASDLAQEAMLKAFRSISKFRGEASFKTWLYHITANVCRDELRKRSRRHEVSLDEPLVFDEGEVPKQTADWSGVPEKLYEERELQEYLNGLIQKLTPEYRMVIVMREIQELSYEEIAIKLDCSLGTVKSRLNRARKALKDKIVSDREQMTEGKRLTK
ncbi:sigma-70 family RNA polymerase sigma factor [Metallumcola ferriviriculae]|uniref:Sigma-70 family RNA polymerase sigma factor n=1 Tax=Metallumcola ferriviriculae TaxID=3039180 RepID=A0AAU0UPC6_9FIRM|nr:sigma-70 family RNA polymerase sigma factor [Desulfitibacteraceae bacterium MK1]